MLAILLKISKSLKLRVKQKGRILLAISTLKKNKISSLKKIAKIFNISKSTLRSCFKGIFFLNNKRVNTYKLIINKEKLFK